MAAAFWCAVAIAVVFALRARSTSNALRALLAILDPLTLLTLFVLGFESLRDTPKVMNPVVLAAATFTLIAMTGALGLSKHGAMWSGTLSVAGFAAVSAVVGFSFPEGLFVCVVIGCASLLGMRLAENTRRAAAAEASRVILRRFLPPHLAAGNPQAALALVTRPRQVDATILISDLRGFTAFAEKLAPEAALAYLNDIQGGLAACVRRHGGTVDKFVGDGLLAVFGALEPLENHAWAAVRAALDMRELMSDAPLKLAIGVHSGPVMAGCVGTGERMEFTVIGDTVNTASRLEAATRELAVDIVVSDATLKLAGNLDGAAGLFEDFGERTLRGRAVPVHVHGVGSASAVG